MSEARTISGSTFGPSARIHQGDIIHQGDVIHNHNSPDTVCRSILLPRNEDVVPRQDLFLQLDILLPAPSPTSQESHSAALWGLGGAGKSQLALEFAYRQARDPKCSIFWVHADSEMTLRQDYALIAKKLGLSDTLEGDNLMLTVCTKIEATPGWVMIVDNADNLALFGVESATAQSGTPSPDQQTNLTKFIPKGPSGRVLWTSRDKRIVGTVVGTKRAVEVPRMTSSEAIQLFETVAGRKLVEDELEDANALLVELDWLPLAISQAAAYIRRREGEAPIKEYLSKLEQTKKRWKILQTSHADRHRRSEVSNSILHTWTISIDLIHRENEMAYKILHILAFLDSQRIPLAILESAAAFGRLTDVREAGAASDSESDDTDSDDDDEELNEAIIRLREFSFLTPLVSEDGSRMYEAHKLVQEATRYTLHKQSGRELEKLYSGAAIDIMSDLFPNVSNRTMPLCKRYLAHALQATDWAKICDKEEESMALLEKIYIFFHDQRRIAELQTVLARVYKFRQASLGEDNMETSKVRSTLGLSYHYQVRNTESKELLMQVLASQKKALGESHPCTIQTMANLAKAHSGLKEYDEAAALLSYVVDYTLENVGTDDVVNFVHLTDWAAVCHTLGTHAEAEKVALAAISLYEERFGDKHPGTIRASVMLGTMYQKSREYAKAEEILENALITRRELFGDTDPDTTAVMAMLGQTYSASKKFTEAEAILKEAIEIERATLGPSNIQLHKSLDILSVMYFDAKRTEDAIKIAEEVLAMRQTSLRIDDPEIIMTMARLGPMYHIIEQYVEARDILSEALPMMQRSPDIPLEDTLPVMTTLGHSHNILGQYNEAIAQWSALLVLLRDMPNASDGNIGSTTMNLASAYQGLEDYKKAEELYLEGISIEQKNNRGEDLGTVTSMYALGTAYFALKEYASAEEWLSKAYHLQKEKLGYQHPDTILTLDFLSSTQFAAKKYDAAEETISELIKTRREVLGEVHASTARSKYLLGETYFNSERYDDAVKMFVQVLEAQWQGVVIEGIPVATTLKVLAAIYEHQGEVENAMAMLGLLQPIQNAELGETHPESLQTAAKMMQLLMTLLNVVEEEQSQPSEI